MATQQLTQTFGTVAAVTAKGLKLDGAAEWLNFSRYTPVQPPERGASIVVIHDDRRFIHAIASMEPTPTSADAAFRARLAVEPVEPMQPVQPEPAPAGPPAGKDRTITRLAVLNTATAILSSGGQPADPDAVIALAARLEAWATRPE